MTQSVKQAWGTGPGHWWSPWYYVLAHAPPQPLPLGVCGCMEQWVWAAWCIGHGLPGPECAEGQLSGVMEIQEWAESVLWWGITHSVLGVGVAVVECGTGWSGQVTVGAGTEPQSRFKSQCPRGSVCVWPCHPCGRLCTLVTQHSCPGHTDLPWISNLLQVTKRPDHTLSFPCHHPPQGPLALQGLLSTTLRLPRSHRPVPTLWLPLPQTSHPCPGPDARLEMGGWGCREGGGLLCSLGTGCVAGRAGVGFPGGVV